VSASVVLLAACLAIVFTKLRHPPDIRLRLRAEYWWTIFAVGWPGMLLVTNLANASGDSVDWGTIVQFGPMLAIGAYLGLRWVMAGELTVAGDLLLIVLAITLSYIAGGATFIMPIAAAVAVLPALGRAKSRAPIGVLIGGLGDSLKLIALALLASEFLPGGALLGSCRLDKCSVWGQQLGALGTGNAFGLTLAFAAPSLIIAAKSWRGALLAIPSTLAIIDLSASRSALISWIFGVAACLIYRGSRHISLPRRLSMVAIPLVGAVGATAYVAVAQWDSAALTGRGALWLRAHEIISNSPFFGVGPSFWVRQQATDEVFANYATHNLVLEVLVSLGSVGFIFFICAVCSAVISAPTQSRPLVLVLLTMWMSGSISEVIAAPGRLYILPAAMVIFFLASNADPDDNEHPLGSTSVPDMVARESPAKGPAPPKTRNTYDPEGSSRRL
jgi:O-Antigen ligase